MILIVTMRGDVHAEAVAWAIRELREACAILYPSELRYGDSWTYHANSATTPFVVEVGGGNRMLLEPDSVKSVWLRRIPSSILLSAPENLTVRAACEAELHSHMVGLLSAMAWGKFCVNGIDAIYLSERKSLQLRLARQVGLRIPRTIVSNSHKEIVEFSDSLTGKLLYKPLQAIPWKTPEGEIRVARTTVLPDIRKLESKAINISPAIYQEGIDKSHDVRVIVMGRTFFAWSTRPRGKVNESLVDWRFLNTSNLIYSTVELPEEVKGKCISLMRSLNLVFACIDFVIDIHGEYFFLEANQAGQFLYGEQYGVAPGLLNAFAHFLLSQDQNFNFREDSGIRFEDFKRAADNAGRKEDFGEYIAKASFIP